MLEGVAKKLMKGDVGKGKKGMGIVCHYGK